MSAILPPPPPPPPPAEVILVSALTPESGAEAFGAIGLKEQQLLPVSGRVEDGLRLISGMQLFRASSTRSSNPTADGLTARGLSGNGASRVHATLDGVPLADPFFGFVAWNSLLGRPLAGGELVRGGGLGGPGALAGTLRLETAEPATDIAFRAGSRDSQEVRVSLALPVDSGSFGLFGGYARGDGQRLLANPGPGDVGARYRQWAAGGRARFAIGDWQVDGGLSAFDDFRVRGVEGADIGASGMDANIRLQSGGPWRAELAAYGQIRDFSTVNRTLDAATRSIATTNLNQYKTPASGWGVRAAVEPPLGDDAALRLGGEWREVSGHTHELFRFTAGVPGGHRFAGGTQQTGGLFIDGSFRPASAWLLTAAAQIDHWRIGAGTLRETTIATGATSLDEPSASRTGTEASGRLGIVWRPADVVSIRAAGYHGWRLPTLNELYRPFRAGVDATAANAALEPERLWGAEASLALTPLDGVTLTATGFANRLENPIANLTLATGPGTFPGVGFVGASGSYRQRQNLDSITSHGLEADARAAFGATQLTASLALVNAKMHGGGLDGLRPAQAARFTASLAVSQRLAGTEGVLVLRHIGKRFEDDRNLRALPAATTLDASLSVPLVQGLSLELSAENLTDSKLATGFIGSQHELGQPRTLWAGLRFRP